MDLHPPAVSVTAPVSLAIERAKQILFRPFDMAKWIAIGFCAWLTNLTGGGFSYRSNVSGGKWSGSSGSPDFTYYRDYLQNNLSWIVPLAAGAILFVIALWVVLLWLRSRGVFMFLHCVTLNRGEVEAPWKKFARAAHSLWLFRLGLGAVSFLLVLPILAAGGLIVIGMINQGSHVNANGILALCGVGIFWVCLCVVLAIISAFTTEFVAPIMSLRDCTCVEGWRIFRQVLEANPGRFVLYLLFQIVIAIAILFLVLAFVLCTLCIGGLLLAIPFIGTVVMLPVLVFGRSYSLYYLAQYGPEFDVFLAAQDAPPPLP